MSSGSRADDMLEGVYDSKLAAWVPTSPAQKGRIHESGVLGWGGRDGSHIRNFVLYQTTTTKNSLLLLKCNYITWRRGEFLGTRRQMHQSIAQGVFEFS